MIRVGIIADDFTGAADCALQFVRAGWHTELQLRPSRSRAQAVAVTTDSRNLSATDAAKAVTLAVAQLHEMGTTHLYKKIDSTLRGQIRAEVRAALNAWSPNTVAVVCPAFPVMGRTLVEGRLSVNGVPVSETDAGRDPITPVVESHLPTLVGGSHIAHRSGESSRDLAGRIGAAGSVVVVDAADDDQLQKLAETVVLLGPQAVAVGSAGLAAHLARAWAVENSKSLRPSSQPSVVKGTGVKGTVAVVIVTSLQELARRQAAAVAAAGAVHGQPEPEDLIEDEAWERWSSKILHDIRPHSTLLLTAPPERRKHLPPELIPGRFADLTARLIRQTGARPAGVVVTGGDGARAVANALDATGFQIRGEVASGVPVGTLVGGLADGLPFVSKAGGFGDAGTLLQAVQVIEPNRSDE